MDKNAFILSTGSDTAGTQVRLAQAIQAGGQGWHARSMVSSINYLRYEVDLPYSLLSLIQHYDRADLVQLNHTLHGHHWYDRNQGKPTVLMHHGVHIGHFEKDVHGYVAEAAEYGVTQVGSTVNLELLAPLGPPGPGTVTWLPTAYDLGALAVMRRALYQPHPDGLVRVVHAPTDRDVKSTQAVIAAVASLQSRGVKVQLVLVEGQTHAKTMEIKARSAEILVDQLKLGYGCNAVEAWGLGIPVIGAVNDHPTWRAHMKARFGLSESATGLPFLETDEFGLEKTLETLVRSTSARFDWAKIGLAHVRRHHGQVSVSRLAREIYNEACLRPSIPSDLPLKPRTSVERRIFAFLAQQKAGV